MYRAGVSGASPEGRRGQHSPAPGAAADLALTSMTDARGGTSTAKAGAGGKGTQYNTCTDAVAVAITFCSFCCLKALLQILFPLLLQGRFLCCWCCSNNTRYSRSYIAATTEGN